ncbi:unnamed protein product [Microthlaspi erraticum]|uniref:Uncharacterized protein n=1 Tax=Microthlaspi erraticum TaxID=1685480 RepID=A0A6D2JQ53_9BRAS|nr:unnamed protein product [Microthlaspi erraticum]CAA7046131.1 unnamed protein product [Microthlaspi erraticum]
MKAVTVEAVDDGLLLSPSPELQNPVTDPANTRANQQPGQSETTKKEMEPSGLENISRANLVIEEKNTNVADLAFEAEKFEAELEDTVRRIVSWLVISAFNIMAYVFSRDGFMESPSICKNFDEESWSWWLPQQGSLIYYDKFINILICRNLFRVQISFAVFMIIVVKYLIVSALPDTKQTMRVTFNVIFLGIVCGLHGKLWVEILGGNGKLWLFVWATFCVFQFVPLALCGLMYGPVDVTRATK